MSSAVEIGGARLPKRERGKQRVAELLNAAAAIPNEGGYEAATITATDNNDALIQLLSEAVGSRKDSDEQPETGKVRLGAESNRCTRLCRPLHDHSAT
jgi:hypothetical protein